MKLDKEYKNGWQFALSFNPSLTEWKSRLKMMKSVLRNGFSDVRFTVYWSGFRDCLMEKGFYRNNTKI